MDLKIMAMLLFETLLTTRTPHPAPSHLNRRLTGNAAILHRDGLSEAWSLR
jgi:hypothetical protein